MHNRRIILLGTTALMMYQFRRDFIKKLIQNKWEVYTFVCEYNHDELLLLEELGAIPITYNMKRGGLNPFTDILSIRSLKRKIQTIQPDIVFSFFVKPVIYGTIAAKLAKVPKIIGMLEGLGYAFTDQPTGFSLKSNIIRYIQVMLYKISLPKLDDLIFLNPDDKKELINDYSLKVNQTHILGGIGLNLDEYQYSEASIAPLQFLFIGRLLKEKGIFDLVEASRIVKYKYPSVKITILGNIDHQNLGALQEAELTKLINENIFEYPGYVSNVQDWIRKSSVFVLPSYREGVSRSTQEAMAIGRPVITTDVPGCRETVVDGLNGFLVPKWDPEALAEKMIYFIENPNQVNIMGKASHEMAVEKFDADKVNQRLFEIIGITEK